jgi:hypothetical protein
MPYTSIPTVASGNVIDPAWGNLVDTNLDFLANPPSCRVTKAALQTITTATATAILFDTERYDTDGMHSTSSNTSRITFTTAGLYTVGGNIRWQASSTGTREIYIRLNGTTAIGYALTDIDSIIQQIQQVTTIYKFAAADYVELMVQHSNGADLNVEKANNYSPDFWATWIGIG